MKAILVTFLLLLGLNYYIQSQFSSAMNEDIKATKVGYILLKRYLLIGDVDFKKEDISLDVDQLREKYEDIYFLSYKDHQLQEGIKDGDKVRVTYKEKLPTTIPQIIVSELKSFSASCKKTGTLSGRIIVEEKILIVDKHFQPEDIHLDREELQAKYEIIVLHLETPLLLEGFASGDKVSIGFSRILESYPPQALVNCIDQ